MDDDGDEIDEDVGGDPVLELDDDEPEIEISDERRSRAGRRRPDETIVTKGES